MSWIAKPPKMHLELVVSYLRSEIERLNSVLDTIERTHCYKEDFINNSIKTTEAELRRIRKFIDYNSL